MASISTVMDHDVIPHGETSWWLRRVEGEEDLLRSLSPSGPIGHLARVAYQANKP